MANEVYQALLRELEERSIDYVLLRDELSQPSLIRDLDILVRKQQLPEFIAVARKHEFYLVKDGFLNPGKKVFYRIEKGQAWILDVHLKIVFRGLEFYSADRCLNRRVRRNGFYYLSNEDFFFTLLFHNTLAKKLIQEKHREVLRRLWREKLDWKYLMKQARRYGIASELNFIGRHFENVIDSSRYIHKIAQKAKWKLKLRRPGNALRTWMIKWRKRRIRFWGRSRGIVIVFMGPDGAGKSTMIDTIYRILKNAGLNVRVAYMGPWGGSIFNFKERLKWLNPDPYREDYKAYYAGKLSQKPGPLKGIKKVKLAFRSLVYYTTLIIEMYARWWIRILPHLRQGYIVLADRYIYDILIGYKNRPMDYHVGLRKRICDAYPKPDLGILLYAPAEVIYARKPQVQCQHLHRLLPEYQRVARRYHFYTLDTSRSVEHTLQIFQDQLLPGIVKLLSRRVTA